MIQKINNGISGLEASNIIYNNDIENNALIKDVNPLTTYIVKDGATSNATAAKFVALTKNVYLLAPAKANYQIAYFGINDSPIFGAIVGLQIIKNGGSPTNYRIKVPIKKGGVYEMYVEGTSGLASELRVFYSPTQDIDATTPVFFGYMDDPAAITFSSQAYTVPNYNPSYKFAAFNSFLKEQVYRTVKNIYLYKNGLQLDTSLYFITYVGFDFEGSALLLQLSYIDATITPSNYRTNNTYGTVKMDGGEAMAALGIEMYVEFQPDYVAPPASLTNYARPQMAFLPQSNLFITSLRGATKPSSASGTVTTVLVTTAGGANAVQDALNAITDASPTKRYVISVAAGTYKITNSSQFIAGLAGSPSMIMAKDFVDIVGQSKEDTVLWAELPYSDAAIDTAIARNNHQTVWNFSDQSTIKNITFVAKNMRYVVHQDNANEAQKARYYENCDFMFIGDKGSLRAFGIGTHAGSRTYVTGGRASSGHTAPLAIHNTVNTYTSSLWAFKDVEFINETETTAMLIQNSGSLVGDDLVFNGCTFGAAFIMSYMDWWIYTPAVNDSYNGAEWKLKGNGNAPYYLDNQTKQISLAFKSATTGVASKIAFDETSTAFTVLMKNARNYFGPLGSPDRYVKNGVVYFDGLLGLSGYAIGCRSIRETPYIFGTTVSADTIGKRLGDCSVTNKVLGVYVNGALINITFNQNYTAQSNATIIAAINVTLGGAAVAYEHNIGAEYAGEFTDCISIGNNSSTTTPILKGTVVNVIGGRVIPAVDASLPVWVTLDDIGPRTLGAAAEVYGNGRIAKNVYLSTDLSKGMSVRTSAAASRYTVTNGVMTPDANGRFTSLGGFILIP